VGCSFSGAAVRSEADRFTSMASMTFREGIVRRGAAGYEELRRRLVRNALLPARYPEVIVRAQTIDEAVAAVRLARELGLQLATRSGVIAGAPRRYATAVSCSTSRG
jgi:hypothetical protein